MTQASLVYNTYTFEVVVLKGAAVDVFPSGI
jgi:hypothetical protein